MRITHVMLSRGWGGAERLVIDLCRAQVQRGHDVQLVCRYRFSKQHLLEHVAGVTLSNVHAVSNFDWYSVFAMVKHVRTFRPDVINAHMARGTWMGGKVGGLLGIPVVTTIHNYIRPKYCRNVDWFQVTSEDQKAYLLQKGVDENRIYKIPNFSTFPAVSRVPERDFNAPVFVCYGRFVKKKGFHHLIEAFREFLDSGATGKLVLGGDGPEKESLTTRVDELGLSDRVVFRGWIEDVQPFLAEGDLCVIPSVHEPFGIVCLEAMSSGIPIVASRSEGPSEILDDQTAFMCDVADSHSLYLAMREAALHPEASRTRAVAALQKYRTAFTEDAVVPLFIEKYREMVSG